MLFAKWLFNSILLFKLSAKRRPRVLMFPYKILIEIENNFEIGRFRSLKNSSVMCGSPLFLVNISLTIGGHLSLGIFGYIFFISNETNLILCVNFVRSMNIGFNNFDNLPEGVFIYNTTGLADFS
ncbi:hypothetical protein HHI36_013972 [Cryptolaemus montrouzieri]|uniref:Uncharacterized protein n=1 Tax=Cryptolaemus montrouzieri TaxID=559131 RepID=A0ABD2N1X2_9CUCU